MDPCVFSPTHTVQDLVDFKATHGFCGIPITGTYILGVKIRNMKMDFKTGGTWRWVGQ